MGGGAAGYGGVGTRLRASETEKIFETHTLKIPPFKGSLAKFPIYFTIVLYSLRGTHYREVFSY